MFSLTLIPWCRKHPWHHWYLIHLHDDLDIGREPLGGVNLRKVERLNLRLVPLMHPG